MKHHPQRNWEDRVSGHSTSRCHSQNIDGWDIDWKLQSSGALNWQWAGGFRWVGYGVGGAWGEGWVGETRSP